MNKKTRKLKVFEAFSGYGAQRLALDRACVDYQHQGISEVDEYATLSYASLHTDFLDRIKEIDFETAGVTKEYMIKHLRDINMPLDPKTLEFKGDRLPYERLKKLYLACVLTDNKGDISKINPKHLDDIDLFTFSFPCQDISVSGFMKGFEKGSGTRSSLLWECCKIIEEKKPKILLMENVKNLVGKKNKANFEKFINYLSSQGYRSEWFIKNATDSGIPQRRGRVFLIATKLGTPKYVQSIIKKPLRPLKWFLEEVVSDKYILKSEKARQLLKHIMDNFEVNHNTCCDMSLKNAKVREIANCILARYDSGVTSKQAEGTAVIFKDNNGEFNIRKLTPKECWFLMGGRWYNFCKIEEVCSNTQLYKQIGNSIVIDILEDIFERMKELKIIKI